jgi:uncharacterized RDD family membrane protein YckC/RNA polymerase subunit RPABC4/transcription elongation factor Spt4
MFKCPECGYLGFEEEKKCPKCGSEVTSVSSGDETNSIMNPPEGISGSTSVEEESKTALIEEPSQIEEKEDGIESEQEVSAVNKIIEPGVDADREEKVKIEIPENEVDFKFQSKPQQQELPITSRRTEEQKEIKFYPSFISRAFAFIIDSLLVTGITSIFLLLPLIAGAGNILSFADFSGVFLLSFYFLFIIFHLLYYTYFLTITGQTPGKAVFNLKVVGKGGLKLDWQEALLRAFGYILSSIPLGMGFIWAFFDKNNEAWHDKLTGSRVVSVNC